MQFSSLFEDIGKINEDIAIICDQFREFNDADFKHDKVGIKVTSNFLQQQSQCINDIKESILNNTTKSIPNINDEYQSQFAQLLFSDGILNANVFTDENESDGL